jgi:hypothetical protein
LFSRSFSRPASVQTVPICAMIPVLKNTPSRGPFLGRFPWVTRGRIRWVNLGADGPTTEYP